MINDSTHCSEEQITGLGATFGSGQLNQVYEARLLKNGPGLADRRLNQSTNLKKLSSKKEYRMSKNRIYWQFKHTS